MKRIIWFLTWMIIFSPAMAAKLLAVEIKEKAGQPTVLFTLDRPVPHQVFTLTKPDRVVVDFSNTELAFSLQNIHLDSQLITSMRSGHPNTNTLRLVLEVSRKVGTKTNPLLANRPGFSLNLTSSQQVVVPTTKRQPVTVHAPARGLRDVVVVLDPGHGGKDPGAMGPKRTMEKNLTFAIASKLKRLIDQEPGMRAVLTRQGDYYIELRDRLKIARKYNADVFISIHADAFINQQSNGASVFALSQSGATSEAARWLAAKENYSELGGVNLSELDDQNGLVRTVLIDLSQTATIGASLHMGEKVLHQLDGITSLHNNKVEQARFMVLKSPDIPSILIETGFISNPREEKNLSNAAYQNKLSQALFLGLKRYFWDNPPQGTRIEVMVGRGNIHLVKKGETLAQIAKRYGVSLTSMAATNHLVGQSVRVGQRLQIPKGFA